MRPRPHLRRAIGLSACLGVLVVLSTGPVRALAAPASALQLDMTSGDPVDANASGDLDVGDTIAYTFTVKNIGTEPVTGIVVDNPLTGSADCPPYADLDPGAVLECHETYAITQSDLDAGAVDNTAAARGADGSAQVSSPTDSTSTTLAAVAAVSLRKDSESPTDSNLSGRIDAGDLLSFVYLVTNTGDLTLHDLAVVDLTAIDASCPVIELAPKTSTRCAGHHSISQDDVDAGALSADAKATALSPGGSQVSSQVASSTTIIPASPSVTLALRSTLLDVDGDALADPGEQIRYTFVISNSGSTTLRGIVISDPALKAAGEAVGCPVDALNAGETVTCTATHTVTAVDAGGPLVTTANVRAVGARIVTSPFVSATVPTDSSGSHGSVPPGSHLTVRVAATLVLIGLVVLIGLGAAGLVVTRRRRLTAR